MDDNSGQNISDTGSNPSVGGVVNFATQAEGARQESVGASVGKIQDTKESGQVSPGHAPLPKKRSFSKKILIIAAVIFLILIIGIAAWRFLFSRFASKNAEITWWGVMTDEALVQPLIEEYQSKNPDVRIVYINQSNQDYRERLTNSLAKTEGPDIFRFHNSWVPMFSSQLDSLPTEVITEAEYSRIYYPIIVSSMTSGSGIIGIPLVYDALTFFINEDIFATAGKSPPTNWDDLRRLARELTIVDNRGSIAQSGVAMGNAQNVDHWQEILALLILQNGGDLSKPTDALAEGALAYYTLFSRVDGVWDETLPSSTIAFSDGKLAMYFGTSSRALEIRSRNPNLKFRAVPLPQLPKDFPEQPDVSYANYWVEGVWSKSKHKDTAWDFLKFISSRESLQKIHENSVKIQGYGLAYPRADMQPFLRQDSILGSLMLEADSAQTWYLADNTFDGPTGINSQISKYYGEAITSVNSGVDAQNALQSAAPGISQVLAQYRLVR